MEGITYRPAKPEDAEALVDIVTMAGEGLPERVWAGMAEAGETPRDVGLRRARREEGAFSYRNATLFELDGRVAGGLIGTPLPEEPVEIGPDFPAAFVPLQELENLARGSWYVNILGVYPEFRGRGLGAAMLTRAEEIARETGRAGTSIVVIASNTGAERLYRRTGYREVARRTLRLDGWARDRDEAILLVKGR